MKLYCGSYLDVTKGEPSQTSELTQEVKDSTLEDLHHTITNLSNRQTLLENSINKSIISTVEAKIAPVQAELSSFKADSNSQLGTILGKIDSIENNQMANIFTVVRGIFSQYFPQHHRP